MNEKPKIDDYAQSMFRFEHLNDEWIHLCTRYLDRVFGDRIKGKTVVDYAFGRGNWSLAFLAAGADKVIAIDAAESNVRKLSDYARERRVEKLEIVRGNILETPIDCKADILWVYGILPCIAEPYPFLAAVSGLGRTAGAESILYSYNAGSLRQVIVEIARKGKTYTSYQEFAEDSLLFNPAARLRARDDLTAPVVIFHTNAELWDLAKQSGHVPRQYIQSFDSALGVGTEEFRPHHLHCRRPSGADEPGVRSPDHAHQERLPIDLQIIKEFGDGLLASIDREQAGKLAVGLLNTHFAALQSLGYLKSLIENYLYLMHAHFVHGAAVRTELQALILDLADSSLRGAPRRAPGLQMMESAIIRFLLDNRIRI